MRIAVIEPSKTNAEHSTFNIAIIQELENRKGIEIVLCCSVSHFCAMGVNSKHIPIPVVSIVTRRFFLKVIVEFFALVYAMINVRIRGIRHAVILSLFPPLLNILPTLCWILGISGTLILHGELEGLVDPGRQHVTSYGFWVKRFFSHEKFKRIRCVVLGKGIYDRVSNLFPASTAFLDWANYPIPCHPGTDLVRDIQIASVGIATRRKHAILFKVFARALRENNIHATHIGMTERGLYEEFSNDVQFATLPNQHLTISEFNSMLQRTQIAVFPYDCDSYRLTVSAAMLDALSFGCKVISLDNPLARDLRADGMPVCIVPQIDPQALVRPEFITPSEGVNPFNQYSAFTFVSKLLSVCLNLRAESLSGFSNTRGW